MKDEFTLRRPGPKPPPDDEVPHGRDGCGVRPTLLEGALHVGFRHQRRSGLRRHGTGAVGFWRQLAPKPGGLHDKWHKTNPLRSASVGCLEVSSLGLSVLGCRREGVLSRLRKGLLPLRGRNGQVKCSRGSRQGGQKYVGGPAPGQLCFTGSLRKKEASFLDFRLQAGAVCPGSKQITQGVVSLSALATRSANACVQCTPVHDAIAFWAPGISWRIRDTQAAPELHDKGRTFHASFGNRNSGKPSTRALFSFGAKECPGSDGRHYLLPQVKTALF